MYTFLVNTFLDEACIDFLWIFLLFKVFEFLEDISINLTDLATKELNILKDLKVIIFPHVFRLKE